MTTTASALPATSARRTAGVVVLVIVAHFSAPAIVAYFIDILLVPAVLIPESLLLLTLALWLYSLCWWFLGALAVLGIALVLAAPLRRGTTILSVVLFTTWPLALVCLVANGMVRLPAT
ncbi:hypothetical protein [Microbacterium sp.]|uniref:hypothetical protein n=1 Tax=Microbacterium sp. TaxID=51671 RepID=UPI0039E38DCF